MDGRSLFFNNLRKLSFRALTCGVSVLMVLSLNQIALAQQAASTGSVDGVVFGSGTGLLEGAKVTIEGTAIEALTDRQGYFILRGVPLGTQTVVFTFIGAEPLQQEVEVRAGETTTQTIELTLSGTGEAVFAGEIVVEAPARLRAINVEKAFVGKKTVIASEKVGKFPDINAAEATQRLTGVYIDDDRGEGRFVSVRGAPASYNRVKLNGINLGSPESNGLGMPLDVFPATMLDQIEVTKSVLPSQDANSVGGEVNLRTPTAFGQDEPVTNVSLTAGINDHGDGFKGGATMSHSRIFGANKQYGFQVWATYDSNEQLAETVEASDWDRTDSIPGYEDVEPFIIDDVELRNMEVTRERWGMGTTLEWKPDLQTRLYVSASYNKFDEDEYRDRYIQELDDRGDVATDRPIEVLDPSGSISDGGIPTVARVTFRDLARIEREWQRDFTPQDFYTASFGGEFTRGSWFHDFIVGYSYTTELRSRDVLEYRLNSGSVIEFDSTADPMLPKLNHIDGPDPYNPDEFYLNRLRARKNHRRDEVFTISGNSSLYSSVAGNSLQTTFGVRATLRNRQHDTGSLVWNGGDIPLYLSDDRFLRPEANSNMFDGAYTYGPSIDRDNVWDLFDNPASYSLEFDAEDTLINEWENDYDANEDVYAAYMQLEYRIGRWTLLGGLRAEHTKFDMLSYQIQEDPELSITPNFQENSYTDVFPGVHIRYDLGSDVIARFSWTNTIRRPNFNSLQASPVVEFDDSFIEAGNPELDPYTSTNFDLSLDWYSNKYGIFGIGVFTKDIEGFIVSTQEDIVGGPYDGFIYYTYANLNDGELRGVELNYSKAFRSGFGIEANITFADSEVLYEGREDENLPLEGQTDLSGNLSLSYERGRFFGRVAWSRVDPFVEGLNNTGEDAWELKKDRVGLKFIYRISDVVSLSLQGANLNEQNLLRIRGDRRRLRENEFYGWNGTLGLLIRF